MKYIYTCFLLLVSVSVFSQENKDLNVNEPSEYGVFSIPLWTKLVLELKETTPGSYEYRIIESEPYAEIYSFEQNKAVFTNAPRANTIDVLFVGAYYNEGNDDKDYKTLLKVRNNLKVPLNYKADIKYYFNDEFENTSIVGAYPGTDTQEIWHHKIDFIALYDFEILQFLNEE